MGTAWARNHTWQVFRITFRDREKSYLNLSQYLNTVTLSQNKGHYHKIKDPKFNCRHTSFGPYDIDQNTKKINVIRKWVQ